ncbi:carboxymuconolactone decarboxylase family protein [Arthrobacter sp. V4I6]|uniref:carboxymuconolactone decarboxylase family protein n=1 Tax=unclassified Arthrobacter TaxID=235627 RepID=UPI0035944438
MALSPTVSERTRALVSIAIQARLDCGPCLAYYESTARSVGLDEAQIEAARLGTSSDPCGRHADQSSSGRPRQFHHYHGRAGSSPKKRRIQQPRDRRRRLGRGSERSPRRVPAHRRPPYRPHCTTPGPPAKTPSPRGAQRRSIRLHHHR